MRGSPVHIEDILTDKTAEHDLLEVPIVPRVFYALLGLCMLIVLAVLFQFFSIGAAKHDAYASRALDNVSDTKVKRAPRGIITDRFGEPLVKNIPSFNVFLVPKHLPQDSDSREEAIVRIASILGMEKSDLIARIKERDWNLSEKLFLTSEVTQTQLVELTSSEKLGIRIEEGFKRAQTVPFAFSHLVGYTGLVTKDDLAEDSALTMDDEIGRAGLEAYYDSYVRGENGKDVIFRNAKGQVQSERLLKEPEAGKNIRTYIDAEFQEYLHARMKQGLAELGRDVGIGIAMNPSNGEVLALVNIPGFENGKIGEAIVDPRRPLFNRAVSGVYNPGSTIKPLVAVGALAEGLVTPTQQFYSGGYIELPNPYSPDKPSRFVDWKAHGWIDLYSALARSSNVYFYEVGGGFEEQKGLGIAGLNRWWDLFGLDEKTEIDMPGEKTGFLPTPEWKEKKTGQPWRIGDTYNVSIGQGDFSVTPIELLNYISAIANGGVLYRPRVVEFIADESGKEAFRSFPSARADISKNIGGVLPHIQQGMRDAVQKSYGTANLLASLPVQVAAKTGTAQIENNAKTNAFFVGYAPYKDPKIVILILVENAREGSHNTIPIAKDAILWYYDHRLKAKTE